MPSLIIGFQLDGKKLLDWAIEEMKNMDDVQIASFIFKSWPTYTEKEVEEEVARFKQQIPLKTEKVQKFFSSSSPSQYSLNCENLQDLKSLIPDFTRFFAAKKLLSKESVNGIVIVGGDDGGGCCYDNFEEFRFFYGHTLSSFSGKIFIPSPADCRDIIDSYTLSPLYTCFGQFSERDVALFIQ